MGSFNAVPKHAHWISDLSINDRVTPIVVTPRKIIVATRDINNWYLRRKDSPNNVSIIGYIHPYNGRIFAIGSYMEKEDGKFL